MRIRRLQEKVGQVAEKEESLQKELSGEEQWEQESKDFKSC